MAKRTLYGTYLYQGQTYGPGESELPEGDEHKAFMDRLDQYEQQAEATAKADMRQMLAQLPAGHAYTTVFGANNSQPEQFEGEPARLVAPPSGMAANDQPQGASVSGIAQEGGTRTQQSQREGSTAPAGVNQGPRKRE